MKSMVDISNFLYPKTLEEAEKIQKEFLKKLVLLPLDFLR